MKTPILLTALFIFLFAISCGEESQEPLATQDLTPYLSLSLEERQQPQHAAGSFEVAKGLKVELFASEPMVINPTNMTIDEKGRVWVCESYNYAVPEQEQTETGGRITILEDTDADGKADKRKVFYQGDDVNIALGISVFGNQVFVARSPNMLVFTDEDGDDVPEKKEVLFTGMGGPGDHSAHAVVFGPDGRFYFNYGNAGNKVLTANGDTIIDKSGNPVVSFMHPFYGGMVFRFDQDGSNFEVLGHNFRNNYEVAIDAYGTLWQSDNDDDGNQGVRINYVMEYGNYGYLDENTGAHWTTPRTGMHGEIPQRHWHQNDPGVVPNLLYTGAGSPAGITVYEGKLLPEVFQGQLIHADAGPNVVRAYPVSPKGAGYEASIQNIVRSQKDQWFRPVDVAVAPDGSLFIADWYDPIVGGGAAGDREKGRIFRVAPPNSTYEVKPVDYSDSHEAGKELSSPNEASRFRAFQQLKSMEDKAIPILDKIWENGTSRQRSRALWLLGQLPEGEKYVYAAVEDTDEHIRIVSIRLARMLEWDIVPFVVRLAQDPSPAVRREVAIALRYEDSQGGADIWTSLALQHDGKDRWYLEALGIGADHHWGLYYGTWKGKIGGDWFTPAAKDITWRARTPSAMNLLAQIIPGTNEKECLRYFRAFDFHPYASQKNKALVSFLIRKHPDQTLYTQLALQHLDAEHLSMTPELYAALDDALENLKGTWQYVDLVKKFNLTQKKEELLELVIQTKDKEIGAYAARLLIDPHSFEGASLLKHRIYEDGTDAISLIQAIQSIGSGTSLGLLKEVTLDDQLSFGVRKAAIQAMGNTWPGEDYVLASVKEDSFPDELKEVAASILFSVYRTSIHEEAEKYLQRPASGEQAELPPIRVLTATDGNAERGQQVFNTYCQACHVVKGEGINFGPELSLIGEKLSREGLYRAIIYPSEGVNYNYETYQLTMKSGDKAVGILASETDTQIDLKLVGGITQSYPKSEVAQKEMLSNSLMTNLSLVMSQEELIDLVSYLEGLRGEKAP